MGENVTLDKMFSSLIFKLVVVAIIVVAPVTSTFFQIAILEEAFIRNIII